MGDGKDERAKKSFFIVEPSQEQLVEVGKLLDNGSLKTFIKAVVPLVEAGTAYAKKVPHTAAYGKVVVDIPSSA